MRLPILLFVLASVLMTSACTPSAPPTTLNLSWSVLDKNTNVVTTYGDGATIAPFSSSDQYLVTLHVQDPAGIKDMDVGGTGGFTCGALIGSQSFTQTGLPASVPTLTTSIPNPSTTLTGFVLGQPFVYSQLDCGTHHYANMPQAADFTVISGVLTMHGNETSATGVKHSITLNIGQ